MIVFALVSLYLVCAMLLVSVVWQDRRRGAASTPPNAREPGRTRTPTLVFRTHV